MIFAFHFMRRRLDEVPTQDGDIHQQNGVVIPLTKDQIQLQSITWDNENSRIDGYWLILYMIEGIMT
jgi:hypothetical protein